ncbi:MAG: isoprenylcysteine carboxylmethyltransferase family protein [Anaerolineales bacterium]|nr:isoprenylcysteine carboxylmethyltransferase family protein [Anaerolineales bacterium]
MMKKPILPPTYFYLALLLMLALHYLLPGPVWLSSPWTFLGLIPFLAGVVFNLLADAAFKAAGTTVKPYESSAQLLTKGVFRISRHPMYLGFILMLGGVWIFMGTMLPLFPLIALGLVLQRAFIPMEERMLREQFGESYEHYANATRKWFG